MGIESGLFELGGSWFDVCVVSAFDGSKHHLGLSCAFAIPPPIMSFVHNGLDLSQACNAAMITSDPKLGEHGGLIGLLSSSRITREEVPARGWVWAGVWVRARARLDSRPPPLITHHP